MSETKLLLEVDCVCFQYGTDTVVQNVSFCVSAGEVVALMAPSGAGKSTLVSLVASFIAPDAGKVVLHVAPPHLAIITQCDSLLPWLTVDQNVMLPAQVYPFLASTIKQEVERYLRGYDLSEHRSKLPDALSGGMRQLAALVRAHVSAPELIVCDEAFSSIDESVRFAAMLEVRRRAITANAGALIITHNPAESLLVSDRVLIGTARPMTIRESWSNPLPKDRATEMVFSDAFGSALTELRHAATAD